MIDVDQGISKNFTGIFGVDCEISKHFKSKLIKEGKLKVNEEIPHFNQGIFKVDQFPWFE